MGKGEERTTKQASATRIVIHRIRMAATSTRRKMRMAIPGADRCAVFGGASNVTPSSGMKRTATNHEATTAMLTTAKIENVYSPAALAANPIGTKP